MKNKFARSLIFAVSLTPFVALAHPMDQGDRYGGIQFSQLNYDPDGFHDDAKPTALSGRLGYFVANQVALEGRLGMGLSDDSLRYNGGVIDVEVDHLFGFYLAGHLPLSNRSSVYGLAGFTKAKATAAGTGSFVSVSGSETDFSYGVGAEFYPSNHLGITLEYVQYLDESDYDLSAISVGAKFGF